MSKYTTEVRYICEQAAGLKESAPANEIDNVIEQSWDKILYTQCQLFDDNYRAILFKKILKHYYLREICSETVGIWKFWMNTRIEEIMPYYNQLYNSALIQFNPLHNVNVTKSYERSINKEDESSSEISGSNTDTEELTSGTLTANTSLYSDTPQGSISGLDNGTYLTNATKDTGSNSLTSERDNSATFAKSEDGTLSSDTTESYTESLVGNHGENMSDMLLKFRETLLNIDMMVIDEFKDLFLNLW